MYEDKDFCDNAMPSEGSKILEWVKSIIKMWCHILLTQTFDSLIKNFMHVHISEKSSTAKMGECIAWKVLQIVKKLCNEDN